MTLMAPTRSAMQQLMDLCADYCSEFCLKFNVGKTKVMFFGKCSIPVESLARITLHGQPIEFVNSCKYLGFHIVSGKCFKFSVKQDLYVNTVLSCLSQPRENFEFQLLYSTRVPRLTFGAAIKDLTASEKQQLNVATNNAIKRIFGFRRWESIRQLRDIYNFESIEMMFAKAKRRFYITLATHDNHVLRFLSSLNQQTSI